MPGITFVQFFGPDPADSVIVCPVCGQIITSRRWYGTHGETELFCDCGQKVTVYDDTFFECQEGGEL